MERGLPSDAVENFKYCLQHEIHRGTITEDEAAEAFADFVLYETGHQGGASGMLDRMSPSINYVQPELPYEEQ